jgi:hypothetical protein
MVAGDSDMASDAVCARADGLTDYVGVDDVAQDLTARWVGEP